MTAAQAQLGRVDFRFFLDREAVVRATDRGQRRALAKGGAYVRMTARRSIRQRRAVSKPGSPPISHQGDYKRSIFFAYDPQSESVVIGPRADFGGKNSRVPELLEFGGPATDWRTGERVTYTARPHMGPALDKSESAIAKFWQDEVY